MSFRVPECEIQNHAREETGFHNAEQEAQKIESSDALDQHSQRREDSPGDHDGADPAPGPQLLEHDVGWNLEKKIADKKYSSAQSIDGFGHAKILLHLQFRE